MRQCQKLKTLDNEIRLEFHQIDLCLLWSLKLHVPANICMKLVPMHAITVNNRSTYWRTLIPFIQCIGGDINRTSHLFMFVSSRIDKCVNDF